MIIMIIGGRSPGYLSDQLQTTGFATNQLARLNYPTTIIKTSVHMAYLQHMGKTWNHFWQSYVRRGMRVHIQWPPQDVPSWLQPL